MFVDTVVRLLRPYQPLYRASRSIYRAWNRCIRPWQIYREKMLIRKFHRLYYDGPTGKDGLWQGFPWFGVICQKCPLDLCVYQDILYRTRPEVIVETGVNFGGSTLFLAHICDLLGSGQVLGCDLTLEHVHEKLHAHPRIELLEGSSTSQEIRDAIRQRCRGQRTMVILDSNHEAPHVAEELRLYAPLVSPSCYLICEDTNINGHPVYPSFGPGPNEAVQDFLSSHTGWTVDQKCERFLVTFNPGGFLLRDVQDPSKF